MGKRRTATLGAAILLVAAGVALWSQRQVSVGSPPDPDLTGVQPAVAEKIARLQSAAGEQPRSAARRGRLAMTFHAHSLLADAVRAYHQAAALDPDDFRWPYLGGIALQLQHSDDAIAWFERSYALRADYPPLLVNYGTTLLAAGRHADATVMFQRALAREPASPHALLGLARVAVLQEDLNAAHGYLERGLTVAPLHAEMHALLAEVYWRLGHPEAAELAVKRSKQPGWVVPFPDPVYANVVREGVGSFWRVRRGEAHMIRGEYAAAAAEFEQAVAERPAPETHTRLGAALARLGMLDEAVRQHEAAVALGPTHLEARRNLSAALFAAGRINEAVVWAEEARQLDPTSPEPYLLLGQLRTRIGEWANAVAVLRQGHAAAPHDARVAAALAWVLATSPDPAVRDGGEAVRLATLASDLTSHRVVEPLDALAAAYAERRQFGRATATAARAYDLAVETKRPDLAQQLQTRFDSYRRQEPWRDSQSE